MWGIRRCLSPFVNGSVDNIKSPLFMAHCVRNSGCDGYLVYHSIMVRVIFNITTTHGLQLGRQSHVRG